MRYRRRKSRDISFPVIIGLLLVLSLGLDQLFERLRDFLLASRIVPAAYEPRSVAPTASPAPEALSHLPGGNWGHERSPSSLAELGRLENERASVIRERLLAKRGPARGEAVEPRPSNPSKHFAELAPPTLKSGVLLRSSAPEEPVEKRPPPLAAPPPPPPQVAREADPPKSNSHERPKAITWGFQNSSTEETPRLNFQRMPAAAKPLSEKLVEVCGRFVPASQAGVAAQGCEPSLVEIEPGEKILIP